MRKKILNCGIYLLTLTGLVGIRPVLAETPATGCIHEVKQQNYYQASKSCQQEAKTGNPKAQAALGLLYYQGLGVLKDSSQAFSWYKKAARQGLASAQYNLGIFYVNGIGTQTDFIQAALWLRRAAAQQYPDADTVLQGVEKDMTRSELGKVDKLQAEDKQSAAP